MSVKILVVSDSHGDFDRVREAIRQEAPIDILVHAGDIQGNLEKELGRAADYKIVAVAGNMDGPRYPDREVFTAGGHRFFVAHGHTLGVHYQTIALAEEALSNKCDVAIYGHTHCPDLDEYEGVTILNPGSVSRPRQAKPERTYAVIRIADDGQMKVQHKKLARRRFFS